MWILPSLLLISISVVSNICSPHSILVSNNETVTCNDNSSEVSTPYSLVPQLDVNVSLDINSMSMTDEGSHPQPDSLQLVQLPTAAAYNLR